ncbi:hypothetical protein VTP01DRAFT_8309 [Rhizomucor pusillus]|uniref:uncharacterized protein n=1 Tax=Rhizomucor pusillus TaxID=4840 RepID=UPI0037443F99
MVAVIIEFSGGINANSGRNKESKNLDKLLPAMKQMNQYRDVSYPIPVFLQAINREHRIGQDKEVLGLRMVTCDAVEERIQERANEKLRMHEIISATLDSVLFFFTLSPSLWYWMKSTFSSANNSSTDNHNLTYNLCLRSD